MKAVVGLLLALLTLASTTASAATRQEDFTLTSAHNVIDAGLNSKDPSVRVEAIRATGMTARTEAVRKQIEGFLSDKNPDVRIAATEALADLNLPQSKPALEGILDNDPVPEVQFAAAKALYKLRVPWGGLRLKRCWIKTSRPVRA